MLLLKPLHHHWDEGSSSWCASNHVFLASVTSRSTGAGDISHHYHVSAAKPEGRLGVPLSHLEARTLSGLDRRGELGLPVPSDPGCAGEVQHFGHASDGPDS